MRRVWMSALLILPFVGSCGPSISYSEYRGGDVLQGKGGTVEIVNGMPRVSPRWGVCAANCEASGMW